MISISRDDTPVEVSMPPMAETRTIEAGDMTIAFESLAGGVATAPLYEGLPGDACQSHHWGYVLRGRARVIGTDGSEQVIATGQAYHLSPGHNVVVEEDLEVVEFSPTASRAATMDHATRRVAAGAV